MMFSLSGRKQISYLLLLIVFCFAYIIHDVIGDGYNPNCVLSTSKGEIDINPLQQDKDFEVSGDFIYFLNICALSKKDCGNIQWSGSFFVPPNYCGGIGKLETAELKQIDQNDPSKGVILNYYEGYLPADPDTGSRIGTEINIECDVSSTAPTFLKRSTETRKGKPHDMVYFSMKSPHACPTSGQSFWRYGAVGPIVLTILCVGIAAYFVIGILIMKFKFKKTGIEIIPNVHLWIGLAMLVKDGVLFIVDGVKALVNKIKNRGNYQEISGPSA